MGNVSEKHTISCYGQARGEIYKLGQNFSQFSLTNLVNNLSGRSFASGLSQHSAYSVSRPWSRVSRRRWQESTLNNPMGASKTAWPVPFVEALFLPEFRIKGEVTEHSFQILSSLSHGAFGQVFSVRKKDSDVKYAMKILSKGRIIAEGAVQQVKDEARIQSTCGHNPFIVNCPFYWQNKKQLFIVSEYVSGGELLALCQSQRVLPEALARIYVAELGLALDFLHNAGVIYRDLKLENILLDEDGHCQLIDFGLSKWLRYGDRTTTICGTLQYMAPEVLSPGAYGHAVDWWSLGVLACCMLCGEFPESAADLSGCVEEGDEGDPGDPGDPGRPRCSPCAGRPPAELQQCSAAARDLVTRLLQPDPRRRIRSLQGLQSIQFFMGFNFADVRAKKLRPRDFWANVQNDVEDMEIQDQFEDFSSVVPSFV